jgi:adenosylcobinamide-phosphate synthase
MGVRLGGRNVYAGRTEDRPGLGDGRAPSVADVARSARLSGAVAAAALALTAGHVAARPMRRRLYAAVGDRLRRPSGGGVTSRLAGGLASRAAGTARRPRSGIR